MLRLWTRIGECLALAAILLGWGSPEHLGGPAPAQAQQAALPLSMATASAVNIGTGLGEGQTLNAYQYLLSGNGQYELDMFPSGVGALWAKLPGTQPCVMWLFPPLTNNVTSDTPAWALMTSPTPGSFLIMQADGNFVLYPAPGRSALWASNTDGNGGATLSLQDDGNLVIYQNGTALWSTSTNSLRGPVLCANNVLNPGQALLQSANMNNPTITTSTTSLKGAWKLLVNTNGHLEILTGSKVNKTVKKGAAGSYLIMQNDGNLVFYAPGGTPQWASNTDGNPGAVALMSNWGDLFVINPVSGVILYSYSTIIPYGGTGTTIGEYEGMMTGSSSAQFSFPYLWFAVR